MRRAVKIALVAMATSVAIAIPMGAMADETGDIKYRQAIMKAIGGHAGAIGEIAKGNVGQESALRPHALALLELTKMVPSAFKNETSAGKTRTKAEVWSDWAGFDGKAGEMERAAMAVADASTSGPGAVKAKLGDLFDTCKGCHKEYRAKKEE